MPPISRYIPLIGLTFLLYLGTAQAEMSLQQIEQGLNKTRHAEGRFSQWDSKGNKAEGSFTLSRPGKLRFDYYAHDMRIIADGRWIWISNKSGANLSQIWLASTPLSLLLAETIKLDNSEYTIRHQEKDGDIELWITPKKKTLGGQLLLLLDKNTLQLKGWEIEDAQGFRTAIILSKLQVLKTPPPASLFTIDPRPLGSKRGRQ
ncbi:MAG: LolA family protein [Parvibaculales bacterium]